MNLKQRMLSKVRVGRSMECWPWTASVDSRGYGHANVGGKTARAHRVMYELFCGEITEGDGHHGVVVMHTCDNRLCCNPLHLKLGTQQDNIADMKAKGRRKGICAGERNGRALLNVDAVLSIRQDSRSLGSIAHDYNISSAAVQRIKSGKAWASV